MSNKRGVTENIMRAFLLQQEGRIEESLKTIKKATEEEFATLERVVEDQKTISDGLHSKE